MTEKGRQLANDPLDFHNPKNELAQQAQKLAEAIRYWGLACAREKLEGEIIEQAWQGQKMIPPNNELYQPTESKIAIEEFTHLALEPLLINAYGDTSGDNAKNIDIILDLLVGSFYISLDEETGGYYLEIKPGLPPHFHSSSLFAKQSQFDKVKKIINDMETAFKTAVAG